MVSRILWCMGHTRDREVAGYLGTVTVLGPGAVLYVRFYPLLFFGADVGFLGWYGCGRIGPSQLLDTAHPGVWLVYCHGNMVQRPVARYTWYSEQTSQPMMIPTTYHTNLCWRLSQASVSHHLTFSRVSGLNGSFMSAPVRCFHIAIVLLVLRYRCHTSYTWLSRTARCRPCRTWCGCPASPSVFRIRLVLAGGPCMFLSRA